jgi:hypothetical protein
MSTSNLNVHSNSSPGQYYYITFFDNTASVIFINSEHILFIDYHPETQRPDPFRLRLITQEVLMNFLQAAVDQNVEAYVQFHGGTPAYQEIVIQSLNGYAQGKGLLWDIQEQPLSHAPNLSDIHRVATRTDLTFNYIDEDNNSADSTLYDPIDLPDDEMEHVEGLLAEKLAQLEALLQA